MALAAAPQRGEVGGRRGAPPPYLSPLTFCLTLIQMYLVLESSCRSYPRAAGIPWRRSGPSSPALGTEYKLLIYCRRKRYAENECAEDLQNLLSTGRANLNSHINKKDGKN